MRGSLGETSQSSTLAQDMQAPAMSRYTLPSTYHYIRFSVAPACTDALSIRKSIQDAFAQVFGLVSASTHVDILWVAHDGSEVVVRLAER